MAWALEAAEVACARHARMPVVTVSVDDVYFLAPSKVGTRVVLKASVNRVFNKSMEVGVRVEGHHISGEIVLINRAYFTMVAISPSRSSFTMMSPIQTQNQNSLPVRKDSKKTGLFARKNAKDDTPKLKTDNIAESTQIRSVPLKTPDQIRRHEKALGRRRVRLERLQLKRSNHLAWPFTPDTEPRHFMLENIKSLEKVALEDESEDENVRGVWELVSDNDDVKVWSKSSQQMGISLKSQCEISAPYQAVVFAVSDPRARMEWDVVVSGQEVKQRFASHNSDICWLAVDMRKVDPASKPTDFALFRSWKHERGEFVIASHSVVHPAVPSTRDYVRAETASSGFIVKDTGFGRVDIQYVIQLNPSGTSIVASELVGNSKMASMRMRKLAEYAQTLDTKVFSQLSSGSLASTNTSTVSGSSSKDPHAEKCTIC